MWSKWSVGSEKSLKLCGQEESKNISSPSYREGSYSPVSQLTNRWPRDGCPGGVERRNRKQEPGSSDCFLFLVVPWPEGVASTIYPGIGLSSAVILGGPFPGPHRQPSSVCSFSSIWVLAVNTVLLHVFGDALQTYCHSWHRHGRLFFCTSILNSSSSQFFLKHKNKNPYSKAFCGSPYSLI